MSIAQNYPAIFPSLSLDFAAVQALDPRITFTRASTATYYGTQTAKAEENLLLQSQDFTTSWSNTSSSDTANTSVAPDGTTTADTVTAAAGTAITPLVSQGALGSTSGLTYVFSVFAKAGTYSVLQLTNINFQASSAHANFDLSAGTVGTSANCTASIENAGSGWYRCIIVFSATATVTNGAVYAVLSASTSANRFATWNPVGTETILLWGAQLEQRSAVTAYTPTTTQPITNYIPQLLTAASGVARFDHNPTTFESLGLLIEEQRANLCLQSENFATTWTTAQASITTNTAIAPDGTLTGDKLVEDTANNAHAVQQVRSFTTGTTYSFSVYVKAAERTRINIQAATTATFGISANFDLSNGTIISTTFGSASIQNVGNGWYRCTAIGASTQTASTNIRINLISSGTATNYAGNGFSGLFLWGAQLEAGAFATSYIPTVASQVTRADDSASMTGTNFSSWYNAGEGTMYAEADANGYSATAVFVQNSFVISDGTSLNTLQLRAYSNTAGGLDFDTTGATSGAVQFDTSGFLTNTPNVFVKTALGYKTNDVAASHQGQAVSTDSSVILPVVNQAWIGSLTAAAQKLNGTIRKIAFYPIRCTNAQLQALTS